jgi:hypothetical protein
VLVDPTMKPVLKPPGTKYLKLKRDVLLSNFAFTSNLRHYTMAVRPSTSTGISSGAASTSAAAAAATAEEAELEQRLQRFVFSRDAAQLAGADTRSHFSSTSALLSTI